MTAGTEKTAVAVIGAGAAGLLAGIAAARAGAATTVYERAPRAGKKIAISGGGRCNFTNTLDPRSFLRLFGDPNAARLGHALRAFSRDDLVDLLARRGVEGEVERNHRLYAKSGRGTDVVDALVAELAEAGAALVTSARVASIDPDPPPDGGFSLEVELPGGTERRRAAAVVVATGGLSYPGTGSTGDGFAWARRLGHVVTPLRPALVGLAIEEAWTRGLSGLSWQDAQLTLRPPADPAAAAGARLPKAIITEHAEILFAHFGITGPAVLDVSNAFVRSGLARAVLEIDFFPDASIEEMDARVLELFHERPGRSPANALEGMLPARLLDRMEKEAIGGGETVTCSQLPREARRRIVELTKGTRVTVTGTRSVEHGEVTAGGVDWKDIDPATLESRIIPGLFFSGEVLDVAGRCGGFNLQAAFSTGWLAGQSAAGRAASPAR
jgi:predicted Rossmann fold flavoprotein